MAKEVLEGIVVKIENVSDDLSFVTLVSEESKWQGEKRVPVYLFVLSELQTKEVKIITDCDSEYNNFDQTIMSRNVSQQVCMKYSDIARVNNKYSIRNPF